MAKHLAARGAATVARAALVLLVILVAFAAGRLARADAQSGGLSASASRAETGDAPAVRDSALVGERAIAPLDAPPVVRRVIAAANRIRTRPYIWGGGHLRWRSRGYDCSGSVSYALHGGGLLNVPLVSGSFEHWGAPGPGRWITIYANPTHVYAVIAGLRWDTVGDLRGTGPRWHAEPPYPRGFVVRHPVGY
jgi:cell wall-associated NlpC family hydrolase